MSMSLRKLEAKGGKAVGKKHGVRLYERTGRLPSGRAWKRTEAEISAFREAVLSDPKYGGPGRIAPDVRAILLGAVDCIAIQKLGMLYVKRAGVMRLDELARGNLELHSVLSKQLLGYLNTARLNLTAAAALAAQKQPEGPIPTIAEIIQEHDRAEAQAGQGKGNGNGQGEAAPGSVGNGAVLAQDERSPDDEGKDQGDQGAVTGGDDAAS